jgi:site-specific DNA-cytosine methylase
MIFYFPYFPKVKAAFSGAPSPRSGHPADGWPWRATPAKTWRLQGFSDGVAADLEIYSV